VPPGMFVERLSSTTYRFALSGRDDAGESWRLVFDLTPDDRETRTYDTSGNFQDFPIREFTWGEYDLLDPPEACRARLNRGAAPWVRVVVTRLDAERAEGHFEVIEGTYYYEPDDVCPRAAIEPVGFTVPVD
jgi:hypothetical protein